MKVLFNPLNIRATRPLIIGSTMLATTLLTGCSKNYNSSSNDSFEKQKNEEQVEPVNHPQNTLPIDLTKPNLPTINVEEYKINGHTVARNTTLKFKNINGNEIIITNPSSADLALYKAIKECSTDKNPDITDVYTFVASALENGIATPGSFSEKGPQASINPSYVFFELVKYATTPKSPKSDTISVEEYTKMMAAWPNVLK